MDSCNFFASRYMLLHAVWLLPTFRSVSSAVKLADLHNPCLEWVITVKIVYYTQDFVVVVCRLISKL